MTLAEMDKNTFKWEHPTLHTGDVIQRGSRKWILLENPVLVPGERSGQDHLFYSGRTQFITEECPNHFNEVTTRFQVAPDSARIQP